MATTASEKYTSADFQYLEGLEPVRNMPAMYIGGVDKTGLHHLVWEIVDNAVDEYINGFADEIKVILHKSGDALSVVDSGRGIPVDPHPKYKIPGLELILTKLHAGAKFGESDAYFRTGGRHGVGSSVVNALSRKLVATVRRDGFEWQQTFKRGKPTTELNQLRPFRGHGTTMYFEPDPEIFKTTYFDPDLIRQRLEDMAYVHSGLKIVFEREDTKDSFDLSHPGGIPEFLDRLVKETGRDPVTETAFTLARDNGEKMEVALRWTEATDEVFRSYANGIRTAAGGTHENGFKGAIVKAVRNYIETHSIKTKDVTITAEDIREGAVGIVSVFLRKPDFQGQTKEKLLNPDMTAAVDGWMRPALEAWLNSNRSAADQIIGRIVLAARARAASRQAVDEVKRKSSGSRRLNLPGKLADCSVKSREDSELFLVEGDSAGGCFAGDTQVALADGRNLTFEAIVEEQARGIEHFCYTIRNDGKIGLERFINARKTRADAEVVRVTLDNNEQILCTPDHLFMVPGGAYRQADQLAGDSLQPLYRKLSDMTEPGITIDGYEMVWDHQSQQWLFTHMLADWYNRWQGVYPKDAGEHCHHLDFNKRNNNPTNLLRLSKEDHLALHCEHVARTLHRPDVIEKCRLLRQTVEFRASMSERMKRTETRHILSENARAQWEDDEYKSYMMEKWLAFYESNEEYQQQNAQQLFEAQERYWSSEENREVQAERVRRHFEEHPEARAALAALAKIEWEDEELLAWRREKTRQQWTPSFRAKRKAALHRTYFRKTIAALRDFLDQDGLINLTAYDEHRRATRDKTLLRFQTFCKRYFSDDPQAALTAVRNFNHRIVRVERLSNRLDVYDAEVPGTHNFALASGVFVHNSAKQGRDNKRQAVLPLRGKILNAEGLALGKVLNNQELKDLVTALGTSVGEKFDLSGLRYGKIILLMDADADGNHITTLILAFFFRHMTELIRKGHVYLAQPPLYRINVGKETYWARDDAHKEEILAGLRSNAKVEVSRFKGLGEMDADELKATTLDPKKRTLLQVRIDSNLEADKVFVELLGKDPQHRYRFIMEQAVRAAVEDLDV
jgi:DNA gyrase subunit B